VEGGILASWENGATIGARRRRRAAMWPRLAWGDPRFAGYDHEILGAASRCRTSRCSGRPRRRDLGVTSTDRSAAVSPLNGKAFDGQTMVFGRFSGGSYSARRMVTTTGALATGSAHQPGDAGSRRAAAVTDVAEVVESRRCREVGSASSEKLRKLDVLPSNKPLQRTQSPQGNWSNINEPLVRRPRR